MVDLRLVPIDPDGTPRGVRGALPKMVNEVLVATKALYAAVGFHEPWVGYLALDGPTPVGTCGYKSPPVDGRVEIAYYTFPEFEGKGVATAMAAELVAMALDEAPDLIVAAQTLPESNASTRILKKLGFRQVGTAQDDEVGEVWEWQLPGRADS